MSWDELAFIGYPVTEDAVNKLCRDITKYRREAAGPEEISSIQDVSSDQLINWKV